MTERRIARAKTPRNDLTAEYVRRIIDYDPETGAMTRKVRSDVSNTVNTRYAGKDAGTVTACGYVSVSIDRGRYYAHRLAWLIMTGEWPSGEIDHKDGNRSNNKWKNLRDTTREENACNHRKYSSTSSGVKGVYWCRQNDKWRARIKRGGKTHHLGLFDDLSDAKVAYDRAAKSIHGEFARLD